MWWWFKINKSAVQLRPTRPAVRRARLRPDSTNARFVFVSAPNELLATRVLPLTSCLFVLVASSNMAASLSNAIIYIWTPSEVRVARLPRADPPVYSSAHEVPCCGVWVLGRPEPTSTFGVRPWSVATAHAQYVGRPTNSSIGLAHPRCTRGGVNASRQCRVDSPLLQLALVTRLATPVRPWLSGASLRPLRRMAPELAQTPNRRAHEVLGPYTWGFRNVKCSIRNNNLI